MNGIDTAERALLRADEARAVAREAETTAKRAEAYARDGVAAAYGEVGKLAREMAGVRSEMRAGFARLERSVGAARAKAESLPELVESAVEEATSPDALAAPLAELRDREDLAARKARDKARWKVAKEIGVGIAIAIGGGGGFALLERLFHLGGH